MNAKRGSGGADEKRERWLTPVYRLPMSKGNDVAEYSNLVIKCLIVFGEHTAYTIWWQYYSESTRGRGPFLTASLMFHLINK